eukprot:COSAG01_NODE_14653_length_1425_cov_13.525641_1_plen_49_part_10
MSNGILATNILGSIEKDIVMDCLGNTVDPRTLYSVRNILRRRYPTYLAY